MASLRDEIGDFVGIPNSFVEDDKQTAGSRVVFMLLRYHTHRKRKRAFPGFETLMRETGLSRQKTAAAIKVLVESGWLVKHKRFADTTEYELRFPEAACSSTMELRQDAPLVPLWNDVSSTMEPTPLITTKTEFTKIDAPIRSNGYKKKLKPPEEKWLYPPPDFQLTEVLYLWLAEMCFALPESELKDATDAWRDSRESKPNHFKRTLAMWEADWKKFIRVYWNIRQQRNGNGHHDPKPVQRVQTIRERMGLAG